MITWQRYKEYLFGKGAEDTTFIETVSKIFEHAVQEGDAPEEACKNFIHRIANHTFNLPNVDRTLQWFITDCVCGPGAFKYLTACNSNNLIGLKIVGFEPYIVTPSKSIVCSTIGDHTGCTNSYVFSTVINLFEEVVRDVHFHMSFDDAIEYVLRQERTDTAMRIIQAFSVKHNEGAKYSQKKDQLDTLFPSEGVDEQTMRLNYVLKDISESEPHKYKALVVKYLDVIEEAVLKEHTRDKSV